MHRTRLLGIHMLNSFSDYMADLPNRTRCKLKFHSIRPDTECYGNPCNIHSDPNILYVRCRAMANGSKSVPISHMSELFMVFGVFKQLAIRQFPSSSRHGNVHLFARSRLQAKVAEIHVFGVIQVRHR